MAKEKFPVTPAVRVLREHAVSFEGHCYPYEGKGGTAASSRHLGVDEHRVVKTLIMEDDDKNPLIVLMHGDREVSTRELARVIGAKSVSPCTPDTANRHSGYQVGGTSPFGTRKTMPVYLEESVLELDTIYINGGKRGFLVALDPREIVRLLAPVLVKVAIPGKGGVMEGGAQYQACAEAIRSAKALLITAGAGMGVDSGLPDFRGDKGFWNAYPMYERLGLSFIEAANPVHFQRDPAFGWGFYGHRTNLYRETVPHAGFQMLLDWIERFGLDHFVVTSNVDGQFQKAGFIEDRIFEVHGSIHHLQCLSPCSMAIWANNGEIVVDHGTMRAKQYPHCISCGATARPNVLMFGDFSWISRRTDIQNSLFQQFLEEIGASPLVIIEMGAGTSIPTIRSLGERLGRRTGSTLIRINPRESEAPAGAFSLSVGALEGLRGIATRLEHQ